MGNCHLYEEHIEPIQTQLQKEPYPFPTVLVKELRENIDDYLLEDFEVINYQHHPAIKFEMIV
jgi:thymidylate synthase